MAKLPAGITRIDLLNGEHRYEIRKAIRDHRIHERYHTLEQAKNRLRTWTESVLSGQYITNRITLEKLAYEWIEHKRPSLEGHTLRDYKSILKNRIVPRFGRLDVSQIHTLAIQQFINQVLEETSPDTANKTLTIFRQMYRYAIQWGYCANNPAASVDRARKRQARVEVLTEEEAARLLAAASGRELVAVALGLGCGLRVSEIFCLQWGDIVWPRGYVRVSKSRDEHGSIKSTKTDRIRNVDLPGWVKDNLADYFQQLGRPGPELFLFPGRAGNPLDPNTWREDYFNPLRTAAKIRKVTPRSLRHTYASLLLSKGVDPLYVSRQLGHSTIKITFDQYGHLLHAPGTYREILDALYLSGQDLANEEEEQK